MDVTVYYTPEFRAAPGGVQRYTTPYADKADEWRVFFGVVNSVHGLRIEQYEEVRDDRGRVLKGQWKLRRVLLTQEGAESPEEFAAWLSRNVAAVEVDARVIWANPSIEEGGLS